MGEGVGEGVTDDSVADVRLVFCKRQTLQLRKC